MTYPEAVAAIHALEPRGWRMGLDRMAEFCRRARLTDALGGLGGPQFIHVAGTNGKGSTTAFLQSMMFHAGFRTGAFYSPYVVDYRERIQLGLDLIDRETLARETQWLLDVAETLTETEYGGVTKFEFEAGLGFLTWRDAECDWVALEVGLGGRLDATNVVLPRAEIIVSIGLDHISILGDTFAQIAGEKAGIIKPGVPLIVGQLPDEAMTVILDVAQAAEAPVWRFGEEIRLEELGSTFSVTTPCRTVGGLTAGIGGAMQPHNAALAIAAVDAAGMAIDDAKIRTAIAAARAPGRFHVLRHQGREIVLDGAHNPAAADVLCRTFLTSFPGRSARVITNMVAGHDPTDFYRGLQPIVQSGYAVPIDFARANNPADTADAMRTAGIRTEAFPSLNEGLSAALTEDGDAVILITGSNYLVGEAYRLLEP